MRVVVSWSTCCSRRWPADARERRIDRVDRRLGVPLTGGGIPRERGPPGRRVRRVHLLQRGLGDRVRVRRDDRDRVRVGVNFSGICCSSVVGSYTIRAGQC